MPTLTNSFLLLTAMALAGTFLFYHVIRLTKSTSTVPARHVVHASVLYLPIVLGLIIASKA